MDKLCTRLASGGVLAGGKRRRVAGLLSPRRAYQPGTDATQGFQNPQDLTCTIGERSLDPVDYNQCLLL
eukprot:XP_001706438.1 Hypothetical protein GL50803_119449 [Giardia lamblia ATCC 50803]